MIILKPFVSSRIISLLFVLTALLLTGTRFAAANHQLAPSSAPANCDVVVGPNESITSIQSAINANYLTICVRGGVYNESVLVPSSKPGRTLIAYGDGTPIIDGNRRLPGGMPAQQYIALVEIQGAGTVFDGFEVRYSSGRAVDVSASDVTVRNSSIHDNWTLGILIRGNTTLRNVLIENNLVYNNLIRVRDNPVIYRGERTSGGGPQDWTFDPDIMWDAPFWSGKQADLPESMLNGLALTFNNDGVTSRVYAGSMRGDRGGNISAGYSATGEPFNYTGQDILFHEPALNKWTQFFDGSAHGVRTGAVIDAFQIENVPPETLPCAGCAPVLISFASATTVSIDGVNTDITHSDIVRFTPTAIGQWGQITAGGFSIYKRAAELGLAPDVNIDALDRAPDGRLLISLADNKTLGGQVIEREDLAAFDESTTSWSLYFDGDNIPFSPFIDDLTAAWLDASGNIYVSGDPIGGSALAFVETVDSVARGNHIFNNYGEGLVSGRFTERITLEQNVVYDNYHANLYLNSTIDPLVRGNLVYCTDDPAFRRKGANIYYVTAPGLQVRDEAFIPFELKPPASSGQIIINNIVVGCSNNFGVATQRTDDGGLKNALVAHNIFANARGQTKNGVQNIALDDGADYINSRFINNLIIQTTPGEILRVQGGFADFSTFTVANNLYHTSPPADALPTSWFSGEPGRVMGDPMLANPNPPLPAMGGAPPDPADYRITFASPALDAAQVLAEVADDFYGSSRGGAGLPDIGPHELAHASQIIVRQETTPAIDTQLFAFEANFPPHTFELTHGQTQQSGTLPAGRYSVSSALVEGWETTASCDDGSTAGDIVLGANETVTCTFSSVRQTRLVITNIIEPPGDSYLFDFSLTPGETFQMGSESRTFVVTPGVTYAVAATGPAGWHQDASCNNGDAPEAVTLDTGDLVICTFNHTHAALDMTLTPNPAELVSTGGEVTFSVAIDNVGAAVELDGLSDSVFGDVANPQNANLVSTTCSLPQSLPAGGSYDCAYTAIISGAAGGQHTSLISATGTVTGVWPITATAEASVSFVAPPPGRIIVAKQTDPPGDSQSFAFSASYANFSLADGQSHDSGWLASGMTYSVTEDSATGWRLDSASCSGDDDGTNPANIVLDPGETVTCTFINSRMTTAPQESFYVTTPIAGKVRTLAYSPGDILLYDTVLNTWTVHFDASLFGISKPLNDFVLMDDGSILMAFKAQVKPRGQNGAIVTINPQDVARFVPTGSGANTAGYFELYFDGSDVGLSTSSEKIDALGWSAQGPSGTLLISTTGAATVKRLNGTNLKAADEDLLSFQIVTPGAATAGTWTLAFDGSTLPGMGVENVTSVWVDGATGTLYLTVLNNFTIKGVAGTNKTVISVTSAGVVEKYWDATVADFKVIVDGLHIVR